MNLDGKKQPNNKTWTQFRNVPSLKICLLEKTNKIRQTRSLILFSRVICSYLLRHGGAKRESNYIDGIKSFALVCTRCQQWKILSRVIKCKYVRCKWMQEGKPVQIVSFKWMEDSSAAEILFEYFSLCMDLWQNSSVLGAVLSSRTFLEYNLSLVSCNSIFYIYLKLSLFDREEENPPVFKEATSLNYF